MYFLSNIESQKIITLQKTLKKIDLKHLILFSNRISDQLNLNNKTLNNEYLLIVRGYILNEILIKEKEGKFNV